MTTCIAPRRRRSVAIFEWLGLLAMAIVLSCQHMPAMAADLSTIELNRLLGVNVARYVVTDKSIGLRVAYIGSTAPGASGPTVAVAAGGDIAFTTDGTTADTSVSTDGTIDLSTPASGEDTLGEVVDVINASPNWAAILVDVLPSQASDNVLSTLAETDGTTGKSATYDLDGNGIYQPEGLSLTVNAADVDQISACIGPEYTIQEMLAARRLRDRQADPVNSGVSEWRAELYLAKAIGTYSSGAPDLEVWLVDGRGAGATEVLLWSQAGAASGSASTIDLTDLPPLRCGPGQRLIVCYDDDSTPDLTAASLQVHGLIWQE